jgi:hypothetical protein
MSVIDIIAVVTRCLSSTPWNMIFLAGSSWGEQGDGGAGDE